MKKLRWIIGISIISMGMLSCGPVEHVDTTAMKQQMNDMKIKRITPSQINSQVEAKGTEIAAVLSPTLEYLIKTQPQNKMVCELKNNKLMDSISKKYQVDIRLLGSADLHNSSLFEKERQVLDAYLYNVEKKLPLTNNIQNIGDSLFVYTSPISTKYKICSTCFPNDSNKLAIWSIILKKRMIIKSL